MTQQTQQTDETSTSQVRVWFGRQVICDHAAEPARARAYADAITHRYQGLRVTVDGRVYRADRGGRR